MHWRQATSTALAALVRRDRLGLVTDVDGTISPIVSHPDAAQVTPGCREVLEALVPHLALVAVISGRAVADVRERVGLPGLVYVGNHGLDWWADGAIHIAPEASAARPALEAALDDVRARQVPGMLVEDKGATLSIHYRQTADPPAVAVNFTPLIEQIAARHGLKLFQGRMVFELRPAVAVNKGSAFLHLITQYRLDGALYLGDDTTDVDALRAARRLRQDGTCDALGLGVESDDMPAAVRESADLLVSGVQDVESFLSWLLHARSASSS
ncbi:MAG: trehalose-phosphatase [Anaerolineae bacterium]|nr:trehalose-phosphatase [Anaerolineae bacterium]